MMAADLHEKRHNWIRRHWTGGFSLGISYWIVGWIGNAAILVIALAVGAVVNNSRQPWTAVTALVMVWTFILGVALWQFRGTWRSASRTTQKTGRYLWPRVAKIFLVLGALNAATIVIGTGLPQLSDALAYATGDLTEGPRGVRILRDGTELEVTGFFGYGLAQELEATLRQAPSAKVVHLASRGGRVAVALDIRDVIRSHGLDTYVATSCASACTIAFLAGQTRWAAQDAKLGFHRFSSPGADIGVMNRSVRETYAAAGLHGAFLEHVQATPPEQLWYPSMVELVAASVVTAHAATNRFALSGFGLHPVPEEVENRLLGVAAFAALRAIDPVGWRIVRDAWVRAVEDGRPETAAAALTKAQFAKAGALARPIMPDGAAMAFARQMILETKAIQATAPEACFAYITFGNIDLGAYLPADLMKSDIEMTTQLFTEAAAHPAQRVQPSEGNRLMNAILAALQTRGADPNRVFAGITGGSPHDQACPSLWQIYEAALSLPAGDAAAAIRFLAGGR